MTALVRTTIVGMESVGSIAVTQNTTNHLMATFFGDAAQGLRPPLIGAH